MISFGKKISGEMISKKWILSNLLMILASVLLTSSSWAIPKSPNATLTPGSICNTENSDFTEYRYPEQIPYCLRNVSTALKNEIYEKYKVPKNCRSRYTIDHLIPLSVGGDNSANNLWPEHKLIKAQRPKLEIVLYGAVRDGEMTQQEAIEIILKEKKNFKGNLNIESECDRAI